jgi:hypothetical protein
MARDHGTRPPARTPVQSLMAAITKLATTHTTMMICIQIQSRDTAPMLSAAT